MTRDDRDPIDNLDRQWDRFLDNSADSSGQNEDLERVARLHRRDDAPAPSAELRSRLDAELRAMHPSGSAGIPAGRGFDDAEDTPPAAIGAQRRGPVRLNRPGNLRDWGELAAMLVILVLALLGASLYGDEAYDFAQRQLAADDESPHMTEQLQVLEDEGEVDGLTFEEAQELTPFEIAMPGNLPDGLRAGQYTVSATQSQHRATGHQWDLWQGDASFEIPGEGLDALRLSMKPAGEHLTFPVPRAIEGEDVPNGHLDVVQINGTGVFRSVNFSGEGEVHTTYLWQQGDVDLLVESPFGVDMTDEQRVWVDTPDAPFGNDDVERMIASLIDQGPLGVDDDQIPHRGLTLAQARNWLPTAPYPDVIPEQLELLESHIQVNGNGPSMAYRHASNDAIGDIRARAFAGYHHPRLRERIQDAGGETFAHNSTAVSRRILTEPTAPEVSDYIIGLGRFPDLLLPWMEGGADHALIIYTWDVAGMGFMMSVEVPRDHLETNADGNTVLSSEATEADWLALIDAQRRTAEEHLRPEQHFSVLDREAMPEDELPEDSDWEATHGEPDQARLLTKTETFRYYMLIYDNREVCVHQVNIERERPGGGSCSPLWSAADTGVVFGSGGRDQPTVRVHILPDGYEEVVDENGELIAEVENNVFVVEVEDGETRPRGLIARGPAGDLPLDTP